MSQQLIQGRLKIQRENLNWDLATIKQMVTGIGTPQLRKEFGNDQKEFWSVDFSATSTQWSILQPELSKMKIEANLFEAPDLLAQVEEEEKRELVRIEEKNRLQFVWLFGVGLLFVSYLSFSTWGNLNLSCAFIIAGFVMIGLGKTLVEEWRDKMKEARKRHAERHI